MDPLRLTLIVAGVVVLLAIIVFSRKSSKRDDFIYSSPSSKEFSFGSQANGSVSDGLASEMLIDEEVIVLPRKQKESEIVAENVKSAQEPAPGVSAYNVRTEPKESGLKASEYKSSENKTPESKASDVSEFRAYQMTGADENMGSDIFDDEIVYESSAEFDAGALSGKTGRPEQQVTSVSEANQEFASEPSGKKSSQERFIVLHVIATEGKPFNGLDILDATKTLGLAFGKHAVFHYPMSAAPAGDSKFCLVNMSAEGNFKTNKISTLETNGVSLIMRLPIRGADSLTVFSNMLGVAQSLARKLGGEILDQTRVPLTAEIISSIRSDIAHFDDSIKLSVSNKEAVPEM